MQRNGLMLPGVNMPAPSQPVGISVAQPLNDVQCLAMIAAYQTSLTPAEAVERAADIMVEAVKIMPAFGRRCQEAQRGTT